MPIVRQDSFRPSRDQCRDQGEDIAPAWCFSKYQNCRTGVLDYILVLLSLLLFFIFVCLFHLQIAIMGCIVNGPGEMADADFGYVGGAPGKIDLYVGKVLQVFFFFFCKQRYYKFVSQFDVIFFVTITNLPTKAKFPHPHSPHTPVQQGSG